MNIKPEEAMVASGVARTSTSPEFASALRSASEWFAASSSLGSPQSIQHHLRRARLDCVLKEIAVARSAWRLGIYCADLRSCLGTAAVSEEGPAGSCVALRSREASRERARATTTS